MSAAGGGRDGAQAGPAAGNATAAGRPDAGAGMASWLAGGERPADPRLAAWVFAALVLACFAALLITQRLKHTPTPIEEFKRTHSFTPGARGVAGEERLSFKPTKTDLATVTVQDSSGDTVATLVSALPVARYRTVSLRWNGRRGVAHGYAVLRRADGYTTLVPRIQGPLAAAGEYKLRVALLRLKRSIPSPQSFELVRR